MPSKKIHPRICENCSNQFLERISAINKGYGRFCGQSCSTAFRNRASKQSPAIVFFQNITLPENEDGCWLYRRVMSDGYGFIKIDGKAMKAHRFSYELYFEKIPNSLLVCHRCDVRNCVNPDHLFLGTHKDNAQDMIEKGRENHPQGHLSVQAKLTYQEVCEIKKLIFIGERNCELSRKFNTHPATISDIRMGKTWKNIKAPEGANIIKKQPEPTDS